MRDECGDYGDVLLNRLGKQYIETHRSARITQSLAQGSYSRHTIPLRPGRVPMQQDIKKAIFF